MEIASQILPALLIGYVASIFLNILITDLPKKLESDWKNDTLDAFEQSGPRTRFKIWSFLRIKSQALKSPLFDFIKKKRVELNRELLTTAVSIVITAVSLNFLGLSVESAVYALFFMTLWVLLVIDYEHFLLPDALIYPLLWAGLLAAAFEVTTVPAADAIVGAALGYSFLWLLNEIYQKIRKVQAIGNGDFKLLAAVGTWTGYQGLLFVLIVAATTGLLYGLYRKLSGKAYEDGYIPFGPFLCLGAAAYLY